MMEFIKDTVGVIFQVISIFLIVLSLFKFLYLKIFQNKCKKFYGINDDNFKALKSCDNYTINLIVLQISIMIIMLYHIKTTLTEVVGFQILYGLGIVMVILMIWTDFEIHKILRSKILIIVNILLFALIVLVGKVYLALNDKLAMDYETLRRVLMLLTFALLIISLTNLFSPVFYNPEYLKEYEILTLINKDDANYNLDDIYVKLARNDDGFLIAKGKIFGNATKKVEESEVLEGSNKGSTDTQITPMDSKKVLYIYRNNYRYADPKLFSIKNYKFDEVEVKDSEEIDKKYIEEVQKDDAKKDE
ncbi:hypothetical protein [uncultured Anaerococcus sp.]|uniref:hypothetical protein n=1 Tax=uncultured Anaerococcus sp. TaxID=293428 RepID=UPI0025E12587|nr:hypothetical protein [uncultured Anaerococcus sp.]